MGHKQRLFELGKEAEEIAFYHEIARLGGGKMAKMLVKDVSQDVTLGYDLESFDQPDIDSQPRFIEVKKIGSDGSIMISAHEISQLTLFGERAFIYMVDIRLGRVVRIIQNPFANPRLFRKSPAVFRVSFS